MAFKWLLRGLSLFFFFHIATFPAFAFWPFFRANIQSDGRIMEQGPQTASPRIKWSFSGINRYSSPVVDRKGNLYLIGGKASYSADTVYSISTDGKIRWRYTDGVVRFTQPAVGTDGALYIPFVKGYSVYLLALSQDKGRKLWEAKVSSYPSMTYAVVDSGGRVYVVGGGVVAAFSPKGNKEWSYQFPVDKKKLSSEPMTGPTLSYDEKTIYVFQRIKGGLYAFNYDGTVKWRDPTPYYTDFSFPTAANNGIIYFADFKSQAIYSIGPDGKRKWKADFNGQCPSSTNVSIGMDGALYADIAKDCSGNGGEIVSLDPNDGKVRWRFEIKDGYLASPITIDKSGNIHFGAGIGYVYSLAPDGRFRWKIMIGEKIKVRTDEALGQIFMSSPVISNKTIYIVSGNGGLFAIGE